MKILFLIYHGFTTGGGVSKKIQYQIKALEELGNEVHLCHFSLDNLGHRIRYIDKNILQNFGRGIFSGFQKRICYGEVFKYIKRENINFIYVRSFHNANPWTISLFKAIRRWGVKSVMEIPTYPYDDEYIGYPFKDQIELKIDQLFRKQLAKQINAIVTFSDDCYIFGQKTIRISNGIDFCSIPLKRQHNNTVEKFHLIGVAEVHYWHGYDRLIKGLGEYYRQGNYNKEVFFHIVGHVDDSEMYGSSHAVGFDELIKKYDLQERVIFHGKQDGRILDELFENSDFAIGSLARHRSNITSIKTIKNREYAARGIPFIYSEIDSDFESMPYVLKAPSDESFIDICKIIDFYDGLKVSSLDIRNSISHLSWTEQMKKVIQYIKKEK